jgi:uncharacterized protein involved in exopolysaccharide biosynthesis
MSDEKEFLPQVRPADESIEARSPAFALPEPGPAPLDDEQGPGFSIKRYVHAVRRLWWVVVLAGVLGLFAGAVVWKAVAPQYSVEGSIWIEADGSARGGAIRQEGLLESAAWLSLLRSYAVLDPVVLQERLYLNTGSQAAMAAFTRRARGR